MDGDKQIQDLLNQNPGLEERLWKKAYNAFYNKLSPKELDKYIEDIRANKKKIDNVMKMINEMIDMTRVTEWSKKTAGAFFHAFNVLNVDQEAVVKMWKSMNIKPKAFQHVIRLQNKEYICGKRRAAISKNKDDSLCWYCRESTATLGHILLSCGFTKRNHIRKHDMVVRAIWKRIHEIEHIPYNEEYEFVETEKILLLFGKYSIRGHPMKFAKKPDITYYDKEKKEYILIDVTIVCDENINVAYAKREEKG